MLAGTLVSLSGAHVVYWMNAATFLFSASLILRIPGRFLQSEQGITRGHWRDLREGFTAFQSSNALQVALFGFGLTMLATGLVNPSEIFLAKRSLGTGAFGFGLLWTGSGIGLVAGSIVIGILLRGRDVLDLYVYAFVPLTVGLVGAAAAPTIWVAAPAMTLAGFGQGLAFPMTILIIQRYTSDRLRGRAFTVVISVHSALLALAMVASGAAHRIGARAGRMPSPQRARLAACSSCSRCSAARAPRGGCARGARLAMAARREWTRERLVDALRAGDRRALARAITLVENGDPLAYQVVSDVYPATGGAYAVGITGPPGVGKSSLVSALVRRVRADGSDVGVVSVDPSSPFTHGALLGDRIRLTDHFLDPGVFIRSMGTRGHLGGLAETTLQTLLVLDAAGKDIVFLETVGAGQSEVGIISIADTVVLVLMPGSGDSIQALKAGIMEIPDVIAINKMDHPMAKAMLNEVRQVLALGPGDGWRPPIVLTEAMRGEGVDTLWEKIDGASRVARGGGRARRAPPPEPRDRGVPGRVRARAPSPRRRGAGGRRAAAPPRRRAGAPARPVDRGP